MQRFLQQRKEKLLGRCPSQLPGLHENDPLEDSGQKSDTIFLLHSIPTLNSTVILFAVARRLAHELL